MTKDDLGWSALAKVFEEGDYSFPESLLKRCYRISQEHQYDEDREPALRRLRAVVEEHVAAGLAEEGASADQ